MKKVDGPAVRVVDAADERLSALLPEGFRLSSAGSRRRAGKG